jgi:hypothetical protein
MATTRQLLHLPYGHNDDAIEVCIMSFELLNHCLCGKAETLHVLLSAFGITFCQREPISGGVPSSSG